MKCLTITIINRYLNDGEYYHDSETKIWIQILSFFHLWQRNQVLPYTTLTAPQQKHLQLFVKINLTRTIPHCLLIFFTWLWVCCGKTMSNAHAHNHMSTITIAVFSYLCCDSNTDDNDSHTITTITQL